MRRTFWSSMNRVSRVKVLLGQLAIECYGVDRDYSGLCMGRTLSFGLVGHGTSLHYYSFRHQSRISAQ